MVRKTGKPKQYEVIIRLVANQHPCHSGHKIGDEWVFDFRPTQGLCGFAYNSLFPFAIVLKTGGTFPWQADPDVVTVSCPDAEVNNVFELRRRVIKS
jgi:uncharacterized repeat protein (TIGR04076 family)